MKNTLTLILIFSINFAFCKENLRSANLPIKTNFSLPSKPEKKWKFKKTNSKRQRIISQNQKVRIKVKKGNYNKRKFKGWIQEITTDSLYFLNRNEELLGFAKHEIKSIRFPRPNGKKHKIIGVIAYILGGLLGGIFLLRALLFRGGKQLFVGLSLVCSLIGILGLVLLIYSRDYCIKKPFSNQWQVEQISESMKEPIENVP